jgi:hypothetical protein
MAENESSGLMRTQGKEPSPSGKLYGPAVQPARPHNDCYWIRPDRLMAGEYPGHWASATARQKIGKILDAGITVFIDLTGPGDHLKPYEPLLYEEAAARGVSVEYHRLSITDMSIPDSPQEMTTILDRIDDALATGQSVYFHCWGGVGRTGMVTGCYLVRHGLTGDDALQELARIWQTVAKYDVFPMSPQTAEQRAYVLHWREHR